MAYRSCRMHSSCYAEMDRIDKRINHQLFFLAARNRVIRTLTFSGCSCCTQWLQSGSQCICGGNGPACQGVNASHACHVRHWMRPLRFVLVALISCGIRCQIDSSVAVQSFPAQQMPVAKDPPLAQCLNRLPAWVIRGCIKCPHLGVTHDVANAGEEALGEGPIPLPSNEQRFDRDQRWLRLAARPLKSTRRQGRTKNEAEQSRRGRNS